MRLNSFPHGHMAVVLRFPTVSKCYSVTELGLREVKTMFGKGSALSQIDAPFAETSWIVFFISGK